MNNSLLDKGFQKLILQVLAKIYPEPATNLKLTFGEQNEQKINANLSYLASFQLITVKIGKGFTHTSFDIPAITAKGLDYISEDGGLTAELGVVTIKIHEDTIKQLLLDAVDASPEDPTIKELLRAKIKSSAADALSKLLMEGLKAGLSHMPDAGQWLRTQLGF